MSGCVSGVDVPSGGLSGANFSINSPMGKAIVSIGAVLGGVLLLVVAILICVCCKLCKLRKQVSGDIEGNVKGVKGKLPKGKLSAEVNAAIGIKSPQGLIAGKLKVPGVKIQADLALGLDAAFVAMFEGIPDAAIIVDAKGKILKANMRCKARWGISAKELLKLNYAKLVADASADLNTDIKARLKMVADLEAMKKAQIHFEGVDLNVEADAEIPVLVVGVAVPTLTGRMLAMLITGHICYSIDGERMDDHAATSEAASGSGEEAAEEASGEEAASEEPASGSS